VRVPLSEREALRALERLAEPVGVKDAGLREAVAVDNVRDWLPWVQDAVRDGEEGVALGVLLMLTGVPVGTRDSVWVNDEVTVQLSVRRGLSVWVRLGGDGVWVRVTVEAVGVCDAVATDLVLRVAVGVVDTVPVDCENLVPVLLALSVGVGGDRVSVLKLKVTMLHEGEAVGGVGVGGL